MILLSTFWFQSEIGRDFVACSLLLLWCNLTNDKEIYFFTFNYLKKNKQGNYQWRQNVNVMVKLPGLLPGVSLPGVDSWYVYDVGSGVCPAEKESLVWSLSVSPSESPRVGGCAGELIPGGGVSMCPVSVVLSGGGVSWWSISVVSDGLAMILQTRTITIYNCQDESNATQTFYWSRNRGRIQDFSQEVAEHKNGGNLAPNRYIMCMSIVAHTNTVWDRFLGRRGHGPLRPAPSLSAVCVYATISAPATVKCLYILGKWH